MGSLHSSRSHLEDIEDIEEGIKPAALVNPHAAQTANSKGLLVIEVPANTFGPYLKDKLTHIVCRPEDSEACYKVLDTLLEFPMPRKADYHRSMGRALGYPEEDIEEFVRKFL